ncbi:MAG: PAS domain S-box protein [Spirochaetales bacterium]|nr:PAS domain S-box protein [Spirochaetales bacterium]
MVIIVDSAGIIRFFYQTDSDARLQDAIGKSLRHYVCSEHWPLIQRAIDRVGKTGSVIRFELHPPEGAYEKIRYAVEAGPLMEKENIMGVVFVIKNIARTNESRVTHRKGLGFETLISTISSLFINVSYSRIDEAIVSALGDVAQFVDVSCVAVFIFEPKGKKMMTTHEWCKHPDDSILDIHRKLSFNHAFYKKLSLFETISITKPEDLNGYSKKEWKKKETFRSILIIPMEYKGNLYGAIGFCSRRGEQRDWNGELTVLLEFISAIIVNALERKKSEEATQKKTARLQGILNAAKHVSFVITDTHQDETAIREFSPGAEHIFGYKKEEVIGKPVSMLHLPEDTDELNEVIERIKNGEIGFIGESTMVRKNGEKFPAFFSSYPIVSADGEIDALLRIAIDMTKQKETERALIRAEQEKALILSSVSEHVTYQDTSLKIIWANRAACESVGLTHDKIEGRQCFEIWHGRDIPCVNCPVMKAIAAGTPAEGEMTTPDGRIWLVKGYPVKSKKGDLMGVVEVTRNITPLKLAEKKLRLTMFSIEHAAVATLWIEPDGRLGYANINASSLLGYSRDELLSLTVFDIDPTMDEQQWKYYWKKIKEKGSGRLETRHRKKDGTLLSVDVIANFLEFEGDEYVFIFVHDITGRKKAAEEKKQLEEQLIQAGKMEAIGRLAGGIAHDFNNILTGMQGYLHFIMQSLDNDNPIQKDIEEIKKAIERAAGLTGQLLAFSRKQVIAPRVLNLNHIVDEAKKMLARIIGEDIILHVKHGKSLKNIKCDAHQIDQILVNLAINARQAMANGGTICIETRNIRLDEEFCISSPEIKPGKYVLLRFADTGCGMDKETEKHIFEPFYTTREQGKGTGLGLATVYGIVKQHHGLIKVHSAKGRGTVFRIYFPATDYSIQQENEKEGFAAHDAKEGETILLVEDETMVRTFTKRLLSMHGYIVVDLTNGVDALSFCKTHTGPVHLLLTDVIMPEMNGKQLFDELKKLIPDLKVLYMSGYSGDIISDQGILDSKTNFIYKPFSINALTHKIRDILDTYENPSVG